MLSHCAVVKHNIVILHENTGIDIYKLLHKGNHPPDSYLKKSIFEALQGGPQFKVSDRTEPIQEDDIIYKSPPFPVLFGLFWQLCLNLIHSDSEKSKHFIIHRLTKPPPPKKKKHRHKNKLKVERLVHSYYYLIMNHTWCVRTNFNQV